MAILNHGSTIRTADGGQSTATIVTSANIGSFGIATNSTYYIGTTQNVFNRASGTQTLTGVSIDGNAATVTNGVYTTGTQTIGGDKTFSSALNLSTGGTSARMFSFYTNLTNTDDWTNSAVSIRERDLVGIAQSANTYSPNLNFHWGSRVSNSLWMDSNGNLAWGSYSETGVPSSDGAFYANNLYASIYFDKNNTVYYLDAANSGTSLLVAGNVGIGTTSPGYKLEVTGTGFFSSNLTANGVTIGASDVRSSSNILTLGGTSERMRIDTNGNVGIGTTSPLTKLDIANTQASGITMRFDTSTSYQAWIRPYWNSTTDSRVDFAINRAGGSTPDVIMSVGYGSNVGIGTTSPAYKLDVNGSIALSGYRFADFNTYYTRIFEPSGNTAIYLGNASDPTNYSDNTNHAFRNRGGSSVYAYINSSGNIGIGTTSPAYKLDVSGSINASNYVYAGVFYDNDNTAYYANPSGASIFNGLKLVSSGNEASGSDFSLWIQGGSDDWGIGIDKSSANYGITYNLAASHSYAIQGRKNGTEYFRLGTDMLSHDTRLQAPIFYDSNNTAYYCDPTATSNFTGLTVANTITGSVSGNAATVTNGVYTTGAQTIGGTKTFSDGIIVNGATYYTFNKPSTTNYQTVALFGSASAGLFLTTDSAIIGVGAYYNAGWIATATSGRQIDFAGGNFTFGAFSGATVGGAASWGTVAQLSSAGVFSATGDFRAPIFYDSNDTTYYLDPANTTTSLKTRSSIIINNASAPQNYAMLNIGYNGGGETRAIDIQGGWSAGESKSITYNHGTGSTDIVAQINAQHNSPGSRLRFGKLYHGGNSSTYTMELVSESTTTAALYVVGSVRSPIFYDNDNTAYYINAASGSNLNTLTLNGILTTVSSGTAINFSGQSDSIGYNATSGQGTYIKGTGTTYIYGGGVFFDGTAVRTLLHSNNYSGYSTFSGSVTATYGNFTTPALIMGDAQYGFYVSGGNVYYKSASGGVHYWRNIANSANTMSLDNSGNILLSGYINASSYIYTATYLQTGGNLIYPSGYGATQRLEVSNSANNSWIDGLTIAPGGTVTAPDNMRSPIFYDSNDTNYYGDFAGTSRLNILNLINYAYINGQTLNGQSFYQWEGATFRNPADHTPQLLIRKDNSTTGINGFAPALALYNNNGSDQTTVGMAFVSAEAVSPTQGNSVELAGIIAKKESSGTAGAWSQGSLNFFVKDFATRRDVMSMSSNGVVTAFTDIRSPIFYDSNNTTYYCDPSSTSNLVGLTVANTITGSVSGSSASCTGNAATASNATQFGGEANTNFMRGLAGGTEANINNYTDNGFRSVAYTGHGKALLSFSVGSSIGTVQQEYFYNIPANGWRVRNKTDSTTWSSWGNIVMTDTNQGALTGTVITTGNSSGLSPTFTNLNAAVFYDSANIIYYCDPNGVSSLYGVAIRGDQASTNTNNQIFFWDAGNTTTSAIGFKANGGAFTNPTGNGDGYNTYLTMDHSGRGWVFRRGTGGSDFTSAYTAGWILNNGIWQASASMRAPLFYDSDNTAYYVDAAGTSSLNNLNLAGYVDVGTYIYLRNNLRMLNSAANGWLETIVRNSGSPYFQNSIDGGTFLASDVSENNNWLFQEAVRGWGIFYLNKGTQSGQTFGSYTTIGAETFIIGQGTGTNMTSTWTGYNASSKVAIMLSNYSGYIWANDTIFSATGLRAPIFYDSNDTTYYVDPHSLSNIRHTIFHVGSNLVGATGVGVLFDGNYTSGQYRHRFRKYDDGNGLPLYVDYAHATANSFTAIARFGGGGSYNPFSVYGTADASGDFRAPIFYDSNDTTYYVDAASTSQLNQVASYYLRNLAAVSTDHQFGLYFNNSIDTAYAIYREGGAWTNPYPDLRIAFHTGIKIGANAGYNGVRFYDDYGMGTQVMSVNNGSDGLGANNVYVNNSLQAGSSLRAPIFYDSNDTTYYTDPAGLTRFNALNIGNQGALTGNTTYALGAYHNARYMVGLRYSSGGAAYPWLVHDSWNGSAFIIHFNGVGDKFNFSESGIAYATGDFRAPIFYDSNNTAYYLDPASTSNLNAITAAGNITAAQYYTGGWFRNNSSGNGLYNESTTQHFYSDSTNYWNVASSASTQGIRFRTGGHAGTVRGYIIADTNNDVGLLNQDGNWRVRVVGGDYVLFDGSSVRAQIFYDSNDTNYYCNPASNSVLNGLYANSYNNLVNDFKDVYVYGDVNTYYVVLIQGEYIYSFGRYSVTRGYNWTGPDTWNIASHKGGLTLDWEWSGDTAWGGNDKSIRIIEFNETYSTMVGGLGYPVNGGVIIWLRGGGVNGAQYRIRTPIGSNSTVTIYDGVTAANHSSSTTFTAADSTVFSTRANTNNVSSEILARYPVRGAATLNNEGNGVLDQGSTSQSKSGILSSSASLRAPIFYDTDNTGYYLDAAGTSNLNALILAGSSYFRPQTWIQMDGSYGMYWPNTNGCHIEGNTLSSYGSLAIRGTRGGWKGIHFYEGGNVPHLMFDGSANGGVYFETGGRWASYYSYGNNCWGFGTSTTNSAYNVYAPTGLYSGGRVDGTIFYDTNNTALYCDPNGTSLFTGLTVTNTITGSITGNAGGSSASCTGNAATATILQTARNINGTSFNGSAAITTATWGTARTITIGSTGKSVDGSANVSWSLAELGAAATNQTMFIGTTSVAINRASASLSLTGVSIDGSAASATIATSLNSSNSIARTGTSGNYNTDFQNTPAGTVRHQGDDSNATNNPGGTWWFVDNYRHSNGSNYWGTQVAWGWEDQANKLATRNITANSFGSWVYYLNSGNYSSYAIARGGDTLDGVIYFRSNKGAASTVGANNSYSLEAYSSDAGAAGMSFHRGGYYAVNMGLDPDNVFRIGGWSASANRLQLDMSGNLTLAGVVDATQFRDSSNTAFYVDPASTSVLNVVTANQYVSKSATQSLTGTTACTIDVAAAGVHVLSLASGTTISSFTYNNRNNNPSVNTIMLVIKYAGTASISWTNVLWANGVTPSLTATNGFADVFTLTSYQGGAGTPSWIGSVVGLAYVSTTL